VCRQTAIHNLHAASLNGAMMFILRKGERVCCRATERQSLEQSLRCMFYTTLISSNHYSNDGNNEKF